MKLVAHLVVGADGTRLLHWGLQGQDPTAKLFDRWLDQPPARVEVVAEGEALEVLQAVNRAFEEGRLTGTKGIGSLEALKALEALGNGGTP